MEFNCGQLFVATNMGENKYIREEDLITELLKILDKVNINELGMRQKLEDEIARFNIFQRSVLGGDRENTEQQRD